jgi:CubicO group peptidase (beta-lactamase class C family)
VRALNHYRDHFYQRLFRTVAVPDDLASVTDIDTAAEVDPRSADLEPAAVDAIWEACQNLYRTGVYPLLTLCLRRRGKIVLNRSLGHSREGEVASVTTPICLYSASKAVSAVLVHLLAEQGEVNLLNPVSHYIPAFAAKGKRGITLLQLLTHRGGIADVPNDIELEMLYDHDAALQLICEAQPTDHQGRVQAYHAITTGFIFNELIKVTTGLDAGQYLDRHIRKPMGMRYFRYGLGKRDQARVAINTCTGLDNALIDRALTGILGAHPEQAVAMTNDPRFYRAVIPSVNLFGTAEEVSRFYQMLLDNGQWQGKQVVDPLTVHRATRSLGRFALDKTLKLPMRYSAGFMLGGSPVGIYGLDTQYAYGHLGYANIVCWADPQRDIAVSLMNTGKLAVGPHLKALPALMHAISAQCQPVVDMESDATDLFTGPDPHFSAS